MSFDFDPFENLPDQLKEAIREMMKKLEEIDPDELNDMMKQLFGEDFVEKMKDMMQGNFNFPFNLDPNMMKDLEKAMTELMAKNTKNTFNKDPNKTEENNPEEPYYEIVDINDSKGEIVVDLPGIDDVRMVNYYIDNDDLVLTAENEETNYKVVIPLPQNIKIEDAFASIKNSVFILPFKRK